MRRWIGMAIAAGLSLIAWSASSLLVSASDNHSEIVRLELADAVESGWEEQVAVLYDGVVTEEEYRTAISRALDCAREAGVEVADVGDAWNGGHIVYNFRDAPGALEAHDACYDRFAENVDTVYQTSPAVESMRLEAYDAVAACMRDLGIDMPDEPYEPAIFAHPEEARSCIGAYLE